MTPAGVTVDGRRRYRSRLRRLLRDGDVDPPYRTWRAHVERHYGDVFDDVDPDALDDATESEVPATGGETTADRAARRLFVDAATYDATVRGVHRAIADATAVDVVAPESSVSLAPVHEAVGVDVTSTASTTALRGVDAEALRALYESSVSPAFRRVFGEYYTPRGLCELAVDAVERVADGTDAGGASWFADATVLDPGCGAGAFLTAALRRKREALSDELTVGAAVEHFSASVVGVDVNPVAASAARAAYLSELFPLLADADVDAVHVPVFVGDALGLVDSETPPAVDAGAVDALLGNPPWIPWSRLSATQKRRLREGPVERLGLFDHEGAAARLGHANDDLSLPFVWTCIDRYLAADGVAAFVLKRSLLRGPAGRLLRSGLVGDRPVSTQCVHDFSAVDPFDGVDAGAGLYVFRSDGDPSEGAADGDGSADGHATGADAADAVADTVVWTRGDVAPRFDSLASMRETLQRTSTTLRPLDPEDAASPWVRADAENAALGDCAYRIRHGVKDDAKAVFSVEREALSGLEPTHVFPYLRSKHVVKWGLFGHDLFLVPQRRAGEDNERRLAADAPQTYAYLQNHRERLLERASSWFDDGPFYSLFGLGPYTWAPYKVVWCRLGFKPHFAVVSTREDPDVGRKAVVPGDHCMFLSVEREAEAHYLCALLNSAPYQRCLHDVAGRGKASLSKRVVSSLSLPAWNDSEPQRRLATLSREAHDIVPDYTDRSKRAYNRLTIPELARVEARVDAAATSFLASDSP